MSDDQPENGWDAFWWIAAAVLLVNAIPITVVCWRWMW